eukprot:2643292-Amphidinium_carterae.1
MANRRFIASVRLLMQSWILDADSKKRGSKLALALSQFAAAWQAQLTHDVAGRTDAFSREHYSKLQAAVETALRWYKMEAEHDMDGMIRSYFTPERSLPDCPKAVVDGSIWTADVVKYDFSALRPFEQARTLLRLLFTAMGPSHPLTQWARAELAVLLDTKKHVKFHTRATFTRRGGPPQLGRCAGKSSGYPR